MLPAESLLQMLFEDYFYSGVVQQILKSHSQNRFSEEGIIIHQSFITTVQLRLLEPWHWSFSQFLLSWSSTLFSVFICSPTYFYCLDSSSFWCLDSLQLINGLFFVCRLNGLRCVKSETLEPVKHLTQLDLRDNRLTSVDLSAACSLETLQCQRNQLGSLTLSGYTLRTLHANNNREYK